MVRVEGLTARAGLSNISAAMWSRRSSRSLALGVALCLLVLGGLAYPQTVGHAAHHTHHTATTHASVLCSWLCAAGQGLDGTPIVLNAAFGSVALASIAVAQQPAGFAPFTTPSRGPPSLSSVNS